MSYGHGEASDGAMAAMAANKDARLSVRAPSAGLQARPNSVLQNLTSRLELQSSSMGELIQQLTRISDRLCGGGEDHPNRVNPPPPHSCVGALSLLGDRNDELLKAFAMQLQRLEENV